MKARKLHERKQIPEHNFNLTLSPEQLREKEPSRTLRKISEASLEESSKSSSTFDI
jgi:hypothetical protein